MDVLGRSSAEIWLGTGNSCERHQKVNNFDQCEAAVTVVSGALQLRLLGQDERGTVRRGASDTASAELQSAARASGGARVS